MTREQKLALIVGFSLVLVVGILISDHLSPASLDEPVESLAYASPLGELPPAVVIEELPPSPDPEPRIETVEHAPPPTPPELETAARQAQEETFKPLELTQGVSRLDVRDETLYRLTGTNLPLNPGPASTTSATIPVSGATAGEAKPPAGPGFAAYVVRKGDTLSKIADRTLGSPGRWKELAALNRDRVGADGSVREGVTLRVPAGATVRPAVTPATTPTRPPAPRTYAVRKGDTLSQIAQRELGTIRRQAEILKLNGIDDADEIYAGLVLRLPPR